MLRLPFGFILALELSAAAVLSGAPASAHLPKKPWEIEWADLSKYHDADFKLGNPAPRERRVVFMGDSITEFWSNVDPEYFAGKPYINRGISGQTTAQMLVRFRQDVIALKPAAVVILGGTNDIAQNGGPTTLEAIEDNLVSMVELARAHRIPVVLASVLPAKDFSWRTGLRPAEKIVRLNLWMADYCARNHIPYLDYFSPMADLRHGLWPELSQDGVHPNKAGYAVMEPLADKAIAAVLR